MTIKSILIAWMRPLPNAKFQLKDKKQIAKEYKYWRFKMFLGVYVGYMMYYFNRKNLSYAAPSLISDLGITKIEFGVLGSVMAITYGIGKFLSGIFADKCNIRSFLAIGLIASSLINIFFGFLTSLPLLTLFWGINGGLQSMGYPPSIKTIVYWFPPSEKTSKYAFWSTSHRFGTAILGVVIGTLISINYWRAAFYLPGILGLITGIVLLLTLTDKPSCVGLPPINIHNNTRLHASKETDLSHKQILKKYIFINLDMWLLAISGIFIFFCVGFLLDWSTLFMVSRGISKSGAAYLLSLTSFAGCFGGILAGFIIDKFFKGRSIPIIVIFLTCLLLCFLGMYKFTTPTTPWWIIGLFLSLAGFFSVVPQVFGSMVASNFIPAEAIGAGCGFIGLFHYLGTCLSGFCVALFIKKWNWYGGFVATCGSCLLAIFFAALLWKNEKLQVTSSK
jgi:sugar phosphate permease